MSLANLYYGQHNEEQLDYATLNKYRRLKAEYVNIIKSSQDRTLVARTKLQLKMLQKKFKGIF